MIISNEDNIVYNKSNISVAVCGNITSEYERIWKNYEYWCEGVLFSSLGIFGKYELSSYFEP